MYHVNVLEYKTAPGALSGHEAQPLLSATNLSIGVVCPSYGLRTITPLYFLLNKTAERNFTDFV